MRLSILICLFFGCVAWTPVENRMAIVGHSCTHQWLWVAQDNPPTLLNGQPAEVVDLRPYVSTTYGMWSMVIKDWTDDGCKATPDSYESGTHGYVPSFTCLETAAPEYIIVTIEFNDVWRNYEAEIANGELDNIITAYKTLVRKIKSNCGTCKILLMSGPPSHGTYYGEVSTLSQVRPIVKDSCDEYLDETCTELALCTKTSCDSDDCSYYCNPKFNANHAYVVEQIRQFAIADGYYFADSFNAVLKDYGYNGLATFGDEYLSGFDGIHFTMSEDFDGSLYEPPGDPDDGREETAIAFYNIYVKPEIEKWFLPSATNNGAVGYK